MLHRTEQTDGATRKTGDSAKRGNPRLTFHCPKCATAAWLEWRQLPHLLRCRSCGNSFWIDRNGRIQSEHETGSVRIKCPRCGAGRWWPREISVREHHCVECGFDFSIDMASANCSLHDRMVDSPVKPPPKLNADAQRRCLSAAVGFGLLLLTASIVFALVRATANDRELIDSVRAFNSAVLSGDARSAARWVVEGQRTAFDTWLRAQAGNRPLVRFEPVEVRAVQYTSTTAVVEVSYQRTIQDIARLLQTWRRDADGRWRFDPTAAMQRQSD